MKRYGNERTHLVLSNKAEAYYNETDLIDIYEVEAEDGALTYNLDDMGNTFSDLTADDLNRIMEELYDENHMD
jgi:hypothetical protein